MTKLLLPKLVLDPALTARGPVRMRTPFRREFLDGFSGRDKDVPPEYIGDPIHLTASVVGLQAGSSGAGLNVKALVNPGPGIIEIWGLKFRVRTTQPITGAVVACRLDLGDFALTNGFIPVYAFGRADNLLAEQSSALDPTTLAIFASWSEYTCNLSRPIYVPPGGVIRPQLQHKGLTSTAADVHISMSGRMLPPDSRLPKKLMLPYWAAYVCKTFTAGTADSDASTENDLSNPFDTPLHVERFVGRMSYFSGSGLRISTSMTESEDSNYAPNANIMGDVLGQVTCSIVDSNGYPVVKRLTPFRLIFDAETRSWPVTHALPPGGYYLVNVNNAAWLYGNPFSANPLQVQPCISMHGWREVA